MIIYPPSPAFMLGQLTFIVFVGLLCIIDRWKYKKR